VLGVGVIPAIFAYFLRCPVSKFILYFKIDLNLIVYHVGVTTRCGYATGVRN